MSEMKIASFNVEWMISIFNGDWTDWNGSIPASFPGMNLGQIRLEPISDVPGLCERIADTINRTNAKIVGIQEGPPRKDQMELFVEQFLDDDWVVHTSNSRSQTIHALVHKSIADRVTSLDSNADEIKKLWNDIPFQPWGTISRDDRRLQDYYRRPLMLTHTSSAGKKLEIWIFHTKSKISNLTAQDWEDRNPTAILEALLSRQKLSAEIFRLREYVELMIKLPDRTDNLVIMGDFNDGPLAEDLEREFLINNLVNELVGSIVEPEIIMRHAMTAAQIASSHTTEFRNPLKNDELTQELIDHILVSPAVYGGADGVELIHESCMVEDAAYDANFDPNHGLDDRTLRPSDHRPISARFEV